MSLVEYCQWEQSNGLTIRASAHITERQNAPWVLFCHGFTGQRMGPGYLFVKLSNLLADHGFSSLRFDFCGSGESDGRFFDMTVRTMERDLLFISERLRKTFLPSRLIIFGHSFGGMIASMHAGNLNADGLILVSPVGDPTGLIRRRKDLLEAGANKEGFYENGPHEMSIKFLDALKGFDPVEQFKTSFKGKLLLIQGDTDQSISVEESAKYKSAAEALGLCCDYHLIKGADHNFSTVSLVKFLTTTVCTWTKEQFS